MFSPLLVSPDALPPNQPVHFSYLRENQPVVTEDRLYIICLAVQLNNIYYICDSAMVVMPDNLFLFRKSERNVIDLKI